MLVQRVDVVTGGASAVYGSDAVGGVVNYILDTKFHGIKGLVQTGISTYGDAPSQRLGPGHWRAGIGQRTLQLQHRAQSRLGPQPGRPQLQRQPVAHHRDRHGRPALHHGHQRALGGFHLRRLDQRADHAHHRAFWACSSSEPESWRRSLPALPTGTTGTAPIQIGGDGFLLSWAADAQAGEHRQSVRSLDYDLGHSIKAFAQVNGGLATTTTQVGVATATGTTIYSGNPYLPANVQAIMTSAKAASFTMNSVPANLVYLQHKQPVGLGTTRS